MTAVEASGHNTIREALVSGILAFLADIEARTASATCSPKPDPCSWPLGVLNDRSLQQRKQ
jgi:hypothetical protein